MAKTGYESTSIDDVRSELRANGVIDEEFLKNTKSVLVEKLLEIKGGGVDEELPNLDEIEIEDEQSVVNTQLSDKLDEIDIEVQPPFNSPKWSDYVMRQFKDDELINGCPTCDGCRRIVELLIGPITDTNITECYPPNKENNGTATIVARITVRVDNETHPLNGNTVTVEDVADVNNANTDPPYNKFPSATALTRAEGRALRKLLRLNKIVVAEELTEKTGDTDIEWSPDSSIEDGQISVIDMLCRPERCNLNVIDFINSGATKYACIEVVPRSKAVQMIQYLNKIQQKAVEKPKIGSYINGWRKNE